MKLIEKNFLSELRSIRKAEITSWRNCRSRLLSTATMIHRRIIRVDTCASQMHAASFSTGFGSSIEDTNHGAGCEKIETKKNPLRCWISSRSLDPGIWHKSTWKIKETRVELLRVFFETWENRLWFTEEWCDFESRGIA